MSEQSGSHGDAEPTTAGEPVVTPADPADPSTPTTPGAASGGSPPDAPPAADGAPVPGDPVQRDLAAVEDAMARARAGVPSTEGAPQVPDDAEVAGLDAAHEALRTTLDRVERGG